MGRRKKSGAPLEKSEGNPEGKLRRLWREMEKTQETGCRKKLHLPAGRLTPAEKNRIKRCVKQSIHARYVANFVVEPKKRK